MRTFMFIILSATVAFGDIIYLPDIEVTATRESGERITQEEMTRDGARDLRETLRYSPGVTFTGGGARNESNFRIRGFGLESVPIYVDGIVMGSPFRGGGDAARFLTGDLESVTIHRGYSSTLMGANNLGGAVVMRIAKPKKPLELLLDTAFDFDSIFSRASDTYVLAVGTKQQSFYARGVYQYRDVNHFRLPSSFEPTEGNPQQKGNRLWSDLTDQKITFVTGITPLSELDIWATYVRQDADKGLSPPDTAVKNFQIWEWPVWKRETASLNGKYEKNKFNIETMVYYDKYDNRLLEYYNIKAFEAGIHAPPSDYDEYTVGGRIGGGWVINEQNRADFAAAYKREDHEGIRGGERQIHVNEDTWSAGGEYFVTPLPPLTFAVGLGFDILIPNKYWGRDDEFNQKLGLDYYAVKTDTMRLYRWQAGVFYKITQDHELHLTYARKNHFPTMSQRYSTRFGDVLPNPALAAEIANHFELGYKGITAHRLNLTAAVYYSKMQDKIVKIEIPNPDNPVSSVDFAKNLDEMSFYGLELGAKFYLNEIIGGGGAFSLNKYNIDHNQSGEIKVLDYYPEITANAFLEIMPTETVSIIPRVEYADSRYADTAGRNKLDAYYLVHLKAMADVNDHLTFSAGINNIFDKLYEIREYSPMAGRTYTITLTAKY